MTVLPDFTILVIVAIIGIIIFVVVRNEKQNRELLQTVTTFDRGTRSEHALTLKLLKSGINAQAIFHDLYVKTSNGGFTQIDLVVATKQGIIVFEDKYYSGWIFGNGKQNNWTQILAYGRDKFRFYNPIKQNSGHILHLQRLLGENVPYYSVIVFNGDCELKNITDVPHNTFVIRPWDVINVVKTIKNRSEVTYINQNRIVALLRQSVENGKCLNVKMQHAETVRNAKYNKNR